MTDTKQLLRCAGTNTNGSQCKRKGRFQFGTDYRWCDGHYTPGVSPHPDSCAINGGGMTAREFEPLKAVRALAIQFGLAAISYDRRGGDRNPKFLVKFYQEGKR